MITVSLLGMDHYEAISKTKLLHKKLKEAYGVEDNELEFFAPESFIIHDGFEQTSFRLNVKVEAPYEEQDKETIVKDIISIDPDYPEYMSEKNTVKADDHDHDDDYFDPTEYDEIHDEPYMGDIISEFDEYIKENPDASNEEVYAALAGIRDKVTASHHETDEDEQAFEDAEAD